MRDRDISVERPSSGSEQMSHGGYFIWTFSEPHLCTTAIVGAPAINNIVSEFDCNNNTATDYYYNQNLKCCHECSCIFFIVDPSTSMLGKNIGVRSPPHVGSWTVVRAKVSSCNRRSRNFRIKNAVSRLTGYWPINLHYSSALCFDWLRTWECVSHGGTLCTGPLSSCQKLGPLGHRIHQIHGRRGCTVHYGAVWS